MSKPTDLGHLKHMTLKIDLPIPMDFDMEYQSLVIMVGANGTGKSLILKLTWVLNTIMGIGIAKKISKLNLPVENLAQFTFDKSFENQNFNGMIKADYEHGQIVVGLDHGKVLSLDISSADEVDSVPTPIFMSTEMRTFDQIKRFLQLSKLSKNEDDILNFYKLYDITYVEFLKRKIGNNYILSEAFKERLSSFDLGKYDIQSLQMTDDTMYFTNSKEEQIELTTLSKGEQSIVNMFIGGGGA
jgi:hypothetical protein